VVSAGRLPLAAGKHSMALASHCDLVTKALTSLLGGLIEVLSRPTTRKASGKIADIIVEMAAQSTCVSDT